MTQTVSRSGAAGLRVSAPAYDSAYDVEAVRAQFPIIGRYVDGPPCVMRSRAGSMPTCPEGERFCGIPVWRGHQFENLVDRRVM